MAKIAESLPVPSQSVPVSDAVREALDVRQEAQREREQGMEHAQKVIAALVERANVLDAHRKQAIDAWLDAEQHLHAMLEAERARLTHLAGDEGMPAQAPRG